MDVYIVTTSRDELTDYALTQLSTKHGYNYVPYEQRNGYCADILVVVDEERTTHEDDIRQHFRALIHDETRIIHVMPGGRDQEFESGYHVMEIFNGNFVNLLAKDIPLFVKSVDGWMREGKDQFSNV